MALEYRFHQVTPRSAAQLMQRVAVLVQGSVQTEQNTFNETVYNTSGRGLIAVTRDPTTDDFDDPDSLLNIVAETYRFRPSLTLTLRMDKFQFAQNTTLGVLTMVDLLVDLLRSEAGDAALHSEQGLLLRREGLIMLDAQAGFWKQPPVLARFTLPYQWGSVPSL